MYVAHFFSDTGNKADATFRETELKTFFYHKGARLFRLAYEGETEETIRWNLENAARLLRHGLVGLYSLMDFNCETVVSWCKTGVQSSEQIDKIARYLAQQMRVPLSVLAGGSVLSLASGNS